jgi:hypothetical protein
MEIRRDHLEPEFFITSITEELTVKMFIKTKIIICIF